MSFPYFGRREDARLLTGAGRYTADWRLPGMVHAYFLRSDHAHARIVSIDTEAARAMPGVLAVLTGDDMHEAGYGRGQAKLPYTGRGGMALLTPDVPALARGRVLYVGDPVAIIVADTQAQAQDAAEQVMVDYDMLPAVTDMTAALGPTAPRLHDGIPGNLCFDYEYGDLAATDAAFATAARVITLDLTSDRVVGAPMEPKAALARWNGDVLEVWSPTQGMVALRDSLCSLTGLPPNRVRVRAEDVGGGFGIRGGAYPEHAALALAAKVTGRPVRWLASRSETFLSDYHGRGLRMHGELALDEVGNFLAIRHEWVCDQGAYPVATGPLISTLNPAMMCTGPYRIPAVYGRNRLALTNTVPITAYRGAGRPDMAYAIERLVEQAARETGIDRLELRRRNVVPTDAFPYRLPTPGPMAAVYDSGDYAGLIDMAAETADWAGFEARRAEAKARGMLRGIGIGLFVEPSGGVVPKDEVAITFEPDGSVLVHNVTHSSGQGHETVFPEIVARVLGLDPASITLRQGDPDGPALVGGGAFASRSMLSHGAATSVAAQEIVRKGRILASDRLEVHEADLEYEAGAYRIVGTDRVVTLLELARPAEGQESGPLDTTTILPSTRAYPSGAHVAEVEIDPATGEVTLQRYVAVDDCGVVLNHTLLDGQIMGGIAQGLGQVLGEQAVYDADGQFLSGSFMDYVMPRAETLPGVSLYERPVPSPNNSLGVKGAGEAGTTGSLPAGMNAVLDALWPAGVRALNMPASAHRVWAALS